MNRFTSAICICVLLLSCGEAMSQPTDQSAGKAPNAVIPPNPFPEAVSVPPGIFDGGTEWLNTSGPIDIKDLRGKVVLLDFWTYCCINCIHVIPDLKYLEEKYKNELVVIGVHSAKFDNEKLSSNIRDAILRYEIKHPVVNDSEMVIWRKFGTRSWPTLALIDPEGKFAGSQGGEGNRELFDVVISRLIEHHKAKGTLNEKPIEFELEAGKSQPTPLRYPGKLLADAASNRLFISDSNHNRIVITDLNGSLLDVVGTGQIGKSDGDYSTATFDHPQGMALVDDRLYVADTENHLLRSIDLSSKVVSTLAGTGRQGRPGDVDGDISITNLNSPWDLCHADGTLFIAMAGPHQIWSHRLGSRRITIHAGNAREDVINGRLELSAFAQPSGLSLDGTGTTFFVADSEGSAIRQVSVSSPGRVATIAGTSELPRGQSLFAFGDIDAVGANARFQHPLGVAWHDGFVYVADTYNHKIRMVEVATGATKTWLGNGRTGNSLDQLNEPSGLSISGGKLYIADTNNQRILVADLKTAEVSELQLSGVTPPSPTKTTRILPNMANATDVPEQAVTLSNSASFTVDLTIPVGFKLNSLAPVSCRVFLIEGDQILADAATTGGLEVVTNKSEATFSLPLANVSGTATVAIEMSYGYCGLTDSDVCKLANALWKFSLVVNEDAGSSEIRLAFPAPEADEPGN